MAVSAMFGPTGETPMPRSKADAYFSNDAKQNDYESDVRSAPNGGRRGQDVGVVIETSLCPLEHHQRTAHDQFGLCPTHDPMGQLLEYGCLITAGEFESTRDKE